MKGRDVGTTQHILIIGGGLAGLFCALKLAPQPVTVLASARSGQGASSAWAQGGIAAAVGEGDTAEAHARDTIAAGAGLVDADMARGMAEEAGERVRDLLSYGVPFDKDLEGRLQVSREAAHSARRIVRVQGDRAGGAIMAALAEAVRKTPSIQVMEGLSAEELIVAQGAIMGAKARDAAGRLVTLPASAVVLATGGIGHLYAVTTNPSEARGIGLAIAARAGALLADTEFVQFHPTAIDIGRDPAPLATEALRGEGAVLVNGKASASCASCILTAISRRATSSPAGSLPRSPPGAALFSMRAKPSATLSWRAFPPFMQAAWRPASTPRAISSRSRRRRITTWAAWRWMSAAAPRYPICGRLVKLLARAFMAPTGWRRTRCWKPWCSARGLRRISAACALKAPITPGKKDFASAASRPLQDDELRKS